MIMEASEFFTNMVNKIWEVDEELQSMALDSFKDLYRDCPVDLLKEYKAFLVFNNSYLINITDGLAELPSYDLYYGSKCKFNERLVIPIYGFDDKVKGFVGYDDGSKLIDKSLLVKYLYQNAIIFPKERFMLLKSSEYKQAIQENYICIVDGIFDKLTLTDNNIPATSLLGSNFSDYHREYLKFIKHWIVVADNDEAGNKLYTYCKKINPDTVRISFTNAKDIDEKLHLANGKYLSVFLKTLRKMKEEGFMLSHNIDINPYKNYLLDKF